jgi:hypothetical protein
VQKITEELHFRKFFIRRTIMATRKNKDKSKPVDERISMEIQSDVVHEHTSHTDNQPKAKYQKK